MPTTQTSNKPAPSPAQPKSLRRQVLLGVNLTLMLALAAYLALDYNDKVSNRLRDKSALLQGQANALMAAIFRQYQTAKFEFPHYIPGDSQLALMRRNHKPDPVLRMIDFVQLRLRPEAFSKGPGIIVRVEDQTLIPQSMQHGLTDNQLVAHMDNLFKTKRYEISIKGRPIVVGIAKQEAITVLVWQDATEILSDVRRDLLWRIIALACIGLGITAVVNIILLRLVNRPIQHLVGVMRRIARGELDARAQPGNTLETQFLADEINAMTQALEEADRSRRGQMEKAQAIQHNLRPHPELAKKYRAAFKQLTANEVGGDCVDIKELQDGSVLMCIGDVTGHGVPAAMGAAMLKALIDSACASTTGRSPGLVLQAINQGFASVTLEGDFASFFIAWVSADRTLLRYASAGHEPAYLVDSEGLDLRRLDSTGPLLGLEPLLECQEIDVPFSPGDRLVIFTDGLPETMDPSGRLLGRARVREMLCRFRSQNCEQYIRAITESAEEFRRHPTRQDDVTILVMDL